MNRFFFLLISFLLLVCSCSHQVDQRLTVASSLIESYPDSALKLLDSISQPQQMNKASYAEYALLLTQARDKNYVLPADDSLIQVAVNYYQGGSDREREIKSYFYLGCVYRDLGKGTEAIEAYLEVLKKVPAHGYSNFRKKVYGNLGLLYKEHDFYPESMDIFRKSYELCLQENDSVNIIFPLRNIAHVFLFQNQVDSSLCYYQKALSIAEALSDSLTVSSLLSSLSLAYTQKKDTIQAYQQVVKAMQNTPSMVTMYDYLRKGSLLLDMNQLDSARYYLRRSLGSEDIYTKATSNRNLYKLEVRAHHYKEAVMYVDSFICLSDSIYRKIHRSEISKLMNKHEVDMQTDQLELDHQNKIIRFTITFFCLLTGCLFVFMMINKRKRLLIIQLQQEVIESHTKLEVLTQSQFEHAHGNVESKPDQSNILNCLSKLVDSFKAKEAFKELYILKDLHKMSNKKISSEKRNELLHTLCIHFSEISPEIVRRYGLSENDFLYCILCMCGFSTTFIAGVMSVNPGTLRSRKGRMQKTELSREFAQFVFTFDR